MVTTRRGKEENTTAPYHAEQQQRPKGSSSEAMSGDIKCETKNSGWPQEGRRVPNQSRAAVPAMLDDGQERWMPMMPRAPSKHNLESGTLIASGCWFALVY